MSATAGLSSFAFVGTSQKFRCIKAVRGLGRVGVVQPVAAFQYLKWAYMTHGGRCF